MPSYVHAISSAGSGLHDSDTSDDRRPRTPVGKVSDSSVRGLEIDKVDTPHPPRLLARVGLRPLGLFKLVQTSGSRASLEDSSTVEQRARASAPRAANLANFRGQRGYATPVSLASSRGSMPSVWNAAAQRSSVGVSN